MNLTEYIGQPKIKEDLKIHIANSKLSGYPLEHIMLYGRAGLGKTTLANIIAGELRTIIHQKTGEELTKDTLYELFTDISYNHILFVDETHNVPIKTMELLYGPLQIINNIKLYQLDNLPFMFQEAEIYPFTFIGATTIPGMLTKPLRDRIVLSYQMEEYSISDIVAILMQTGCPKQIAEVIAKKSRATPRIALNYYMRIRNEQKNLTPKYIEQIFGRWGIDINGFTREDLEVLKYLKENKFASESELHKSLGIDKKDYQNIYEPFLLEKGMIKITSKGRTLSSKGTSYVK